MATPEEIQQEFTRRGLSVSEWARIRGFSTGLVYQVLSGKRKAMRGQSHRIAVALGLKDGIYGEIADLPFEAARQAKEGQSGG